MGVSLRVILTVPASAQTFKFLNQASFCYSHLMTDERWKELVESEHPPEGQELVGLPLQDYFRLLSDWVKFRVQDELIKIRRELKL